MSKYLRSEAGSLGPALPPVDGREVSLTIACHQDCHAPRETMLCLLLSSAAFTLPNPKPNNSPQPVRKPAASTARSSSAVEGGQQCLVDEPVVECYIRNEVVDGPWADQWARYVLLRPGMSYSELKAATLRRNQLDPSLRIPGTYRTLRSSNLGTILTLTSNPNP